MGGAADTVPRRSPFSSSLSLPSRFNKCGPLTTTILPSFIASLSNCLFKGILYITLTLHQLLHISFLDLKTNIFHPFHMPSSIQPNNSLKDWDHKDPSRLLTLVQYLRDQYVLYQRNRVEAVDDDRLKFEISTIISREGIEMHLSSSVEKPEEVKFAVPLMDMNINKMVPGCPWRYSQKIYLQVVYPVGRKYLSAPSAPRLKLVSSPELKALFSIDDVKLPPWLDGMCLAEYLPNLEEYLEKQALEAVSLIDVRRHFIEALAIQFGRPVEADPVFCRKATFLSASGVFTFLVHFTIPTRFPKQQPAVMLQSSQHFNTQMAPLKSRLMSDYPWSPRWEISLMAERICEFLADEALNFKRQCSEGQLQYIVTCLNTNVVAISKVGH